MSTSMPPTVEPSAMDSRNCHHQPAGLGVAVCALFQPGWSVDLLERRDVPSPEQGLEEGATILKTSACRLARRLPTRQRTPDWNRRRPSPPRPSRPHRRPLALTPPASRPPHTTSCRADTQPRTFSPSPTTARAADLKRM